MNVRTPSFWWRPAGLLSTLLAPLGLPYGFVTTSRMRRKARHRSSVPVICVGNFVAGGAGKTPVAIAIGALLTTRGKMPAFLSRGYRGTLAGPVEVATGTHSAAEVGDEPLLLARAGRTVVAADRKAGADAIGTAPGTVIVMDDGFQSPTLAKTLSLVVVDGAVGIGNGACVPAGPLRAPLAAQLPRADAIVILGTGDAGEEFAIRAAAARKPVFHATLVPDEAARSLAGKKVLAYAGIGRPEKFVTTLQALGADVVALKAFPDHHGFSEADARELLAEADRLGALLVTTQKDAVRLSGATQDALRRLHAESTVVSVSCRFEDAAALADFVLSRL
ncbi:MAG: tetraacyldisaccharide 4'-kinase [Hyphomicrobiales bacterium]|nr:MAG: tetraacyldisaccharide 4'-kinase [Hyphomicrobiales bacterium]